MNIYFWIVIIALLDLLIVAFFHGADTRRNRG